jgi:hypothetical protein
MPGHSPKRSDGLHQEKTDLIVTANSHWDRMAVLCVFTGAYYGPCNVIEVCSLGENECFSQGNDFLFLMKMAYEQ